MHNNNKAAPQSKTTAGNNKLTSITPYTTMDGLAEVSDAELATAGRTYSAAGRKNRNYRHIARLIKAEQKRRAFPKFEDLNGGQA